MMDNVVQKNPAIATGFHTSSTAPLSSARRTGCINRGNGDFIFLLTAAVEKRSIVTFL